MCHSQQSLGGGRRRRGCSTCVVHPVPSTTSVVRPTLRVVSGGGVRGVGGEAQVYGGGQAWCTGGGAGGPQRPHDRTPLPQKGGSIDGPPQTPTGSDPPGPESHPDPDTRNNKKWHLWNQRIAQGRGGIRGCHRCRAPRAQEVACGNPPPPPPNRNVWGRRSGGATPVRAGVTNAFWEDSMGSTGTLLGVRRDAQHKCFLFGCTAPPTLRTSRRRA